MLPADETIREVFIATLLIDVSLFSKNETWRQIISKALAQLLLRFPAQETSERPVEQTWKRWNDFRLGCQGQSN